MRCEQEVLDFQRRALSKLAARERLGALSFPFPFQQGALTTDASSILTVTVQNTEQYSTVTVQYNTLEAQLRFALRLARPEYLRPERFVRAIVSLVQKVE